MIAADRFLTRLIGVKKHTDQRWVARCPAHDDKSPSLSIRELDDGRLLVHCFAGCMISSVMEAVGLCLADLFSTPLPYANGVSPRHWHAAREALKALKFEALFALVAAENLAAGITLTEADRLRLAESVANINNVLDQL